jgi:hypothetical protein
MGNTKKRFLILKEYSGDGELTGEFEWPIKRDQKEEVFKFLAQLPGKRIIR